MNAPTNNVGLIEPAKYFYADVACWTASASNRPSRGHSATILCPTESSSFWVVFQKLAKSCCGKFFGSHGASLLGNWLGGAARQCCVPRFYLNPDA